MSNIAIIPARGGSKRVPHKNIKDFNGHPIISYSIKAAQRSGLFDRIIVSTDDDAIAEVATRCGAEVPFIRPVELSDNFTPTHDVIAHAIRQTNLLHTGKVCCLYATAPFVRVQDINDAMDMIASPDCAYAFPVTTFAFPIQRALIRSDDGFIQPMNESAREMRSQDLTEAWHDAGQFYCATAATWLANSNVYSPNSMGLAIPRYLVQDIDTPEDWVQAEMMHYALHNNVAG